MFYTYKEFMGVTLESVWEQLGEFRTLMSSDPDFHVRDISINAVNDLYRMTVYYRRVKL